MTLQSRHIVSILTFVLLAFQPVRAEFDLLSAGENRVAASKLFAIVGDHISTYETTNLSVPISTTTDCAFLVQSTQNTTAVQSSTLVPQQFDLSQNFPNPFNNSTKILYSIPVQSHVSLTVYDITGREVATLVNGAVGAGAHAVNFEINNIASGTYYYRMVATGQSGRASVETKKMIVMK